MMFIGYLYSIRSERQLEKEIYYNMAYRWFLGLNINDPVPHHSTISWNRRTRLKIQLFSKTFLMRSFFRPSIMTWWADVSHSPIPYLKANANKHKYTRKTIEQDTQNYIKDLNEAIQEDREEQGKKPLTVKEEVKAEREIRHSTTDSENGYLYRENKPEGFFYLDHRTKSKNRQKVITRHVWEDHKEKVRQNRLSVSGKKLYKKRKEKNRAKLCRFKTAAWASLLQVEGKTECERASSPNSRLPEHEEDCHIPSQAGIGMWELFFCF
ncbi:hypothetical protein AXI58_05530 [Bacillus nakamurai]|uniref:Transposase InsH N-terminal domain-containing protein n=1 Tax=Bacillus nakamurai TaxID=1793963 RepID=A0A150F2P1_9BACI|nr:hypothetical protein AXI58_05530 [Bacillus nakamurai]